MKYVNEKNIVLQSRVCHFERLPNDFVLIFRIIIHVCVDTCFWSIKRLLHDTLLNLSLNLGNLQPYWELKDRPLNTVYQCRLPPLQFAGWAKGDITRCPQLECTHWNSRGIILLRHWGKGFTDFLSQLEQNFNEWLSVDISDKVLYVLIFFPFTPWGWGRGVFKKRIYVKSVVSYGIRSFIIN